MFAVSEAILVRRDGTESHCFFILEDGLPVYEVNKWLEYKGINSAMTSKKYAFELCKFFNYLKQGKTSYKDVSKKDIINFIDYMLFAKDDSDIIPLQSNMSYQTVASYLIVIKEFYKYLEDMSDDEINIMYSSSTKRTNKNAYLYGQIWDMEVKELLATKLPRIKETKEHVKWYLPEEISAILTQFNTLRDKAIFLLTLEGMRISEVINLNMDDYISDEQLVNLQKTKGNKERIVPLRDQTIQAIENYLYTERSLVEDQGLFDALFVNLRRGKNYGQRVAYRNILNIIKTAASKAGLDANAIRTHSGRSTRTMELLRYQSENPEENLTDEQIRLLMGWSSSKSLEPYVNQKDEKLLVSLAKKINEKGDDDK